MNIIKKIAVGALLCASILAVTASCAHPGEVEVKDFASSVSFSTDISSFTQEIIDVKTGESKGKYTVKFDEDTLYRIEYDADGKTMYEVYIQNTDGVYTQYRNTYNDAGEPRGWKRSKVQREVWVMNRKFLDGIDDNYGLDEFIKYDDFTFDDKEGVYRCEEIQAFFDGVYFTDVSIRFENGKMTELDMVQNFGDGKVKLVHTFAYGEGGIEVPENVLNAPR